jgi:hypothetical protein
MKYSYGFVLLFFLCCEMFFPFKGWAQSFDRGAFYFTGSQHTPLYFGRFRQRLPGEGLKIGRVEVNPFLGVGEVYTDNVFRRDTRRKSDFLTAIAPGIQGYLPFGGTHSLLLDYRAAQFLYAKFNENNALAQNGLGRLELNFPGGLKINLQGGHVEAFDPRGSEVDSRQRDITKWRGDNIRTQVAFTGVNMGISLNTFYGHLHFKNNNQARPRDRKRVSGNLYVFVPTRFGFSPSLGVGVATINYDDNNQLDSFSYNVFGGFTLASNRQLTGQLFAGISVLNFDNAPKEQPPGSDLSAGGDQQKAFFMSGSLRWRPTSRLNIRLRPFSSINQSAVFETSTFRQTGFNLSARQTFNKRVFAQGRFLYTNDDFEGGRTDNRLQWRMGLGYRTVKWLGFRLDYIFGKRFSTESQFEFYSNTIMFTVQGLLGASID